MSSKYRTLLGHEIRVITLHDKRETDVFTEPNSVIKYVPLSDFVSWGRAGTAALASLPRRPRLKAAWKRSAQSALFRQPISCGREGSVATTASLAVCKSVHTDFPCIGRQTGHLERRGGMGGQGFPSRCPQGRRR